jgi:L-ascorbate metabolism protein UlaG (beta-lactamase superfamily)
MSAAASNAATSGGAGGPAATACASPVPAADAPAEPASDPANNAIGVRYLGHATVLLDLPGIRILTDPFLRDRLGPLRRHGPVPVPDEIGAVDIVLISHAHPDHFDASSLRALAGDPLVIVPRGMARLARKAGLRAHEGVVGDPIGVAPGWSVCPVPARHWRWLSAPRAPSVGYHIEGPGPTRVYFAGDTARFAGMRDLAGRVDLALLPVGSWGPHLTPGHLSPQSAAETARDVGARHAVPIHWGTLYPPALERVLGSRLREPAARFAACVREIAPGTVVHALSPGEATEIRV